MMFPLGYSEGISISVDLKQLSSICPEVLKNAGVEADQLRDRFCSGKPSAIPSCSDLEHIFAPLFSAPVSVRISLLKLKVLEILIYLSNMKSEHKELTQYFSQQTELIKEIHQQLTEHLDQRFTIAELSKQYLINTSTLKEIFKAVYSHLYEGISGASGYEITTGNRFHYRGYCFPGRLPNPRKVFKRFSVYRQDVTQRIQKNPGYSFI